jgi:transcriptional regulator with XRE-family HTH domain
MPARILPNKPIRLFLREWREHLRFTQERLGERIGSDGVDKGTVSRWESFDRKPTYNVLGAYAEALGIPVTYLFRSPSLDESLDELAANLSPKDRQKVIRFVKELERAS